MANTLNKIAGLFSDSKTRIIALISAVLLIIGIIWGINTILHRINGPLGPETAASVANGPRIESIPGGWEGASSPEYIKQVKQRNVQEAERAKQEGTSAVPTLTESTAITEDLDPSKISGGGGFSILKKLESIDPDELKAMMMRCKAIGALVFNEKGSPMGTVGPEGVVKDPCGQIIGKVGDDCNVRDSKGNIIGKASNITLGKAVYDAQGRLLGTVGPDGHVRDLSGNIIGTIDEQGVIKDLNGKVIPTGEAGSQDTLVYDENGDVIGIAGPDGIVRDAQGKVIGHIDPKTGQVIDQQGRVIGKAAVNLLAQTGAALNKVATVPAGTPVYDKNGRLIGTVGADGLVRDAQGNVIGTLEADGVIRNAQGEIIGKAGTVPEGTQIFDANGNVIGTVGPDGLARDAQGNILGIYDPTTGAVVDKLGNTLGRTAAKLNQKTDALAALTSAAGSINPTAAADNANAQLQAAKDKQEELFAQQQNETYKQQIQGIMTGQASQLFTVWAAPSQQYVEGNAADQNKGLAMGNALNVSSGGIPGVDIRGQAILKAGNIMFGVLDTAVNTDQIGPVMATIVSGPFKGAKLLGIVERQEDRALLKFNVLTSDKFPNSLPVNAIAIDPDTARTALATGVDNHYLLRYGSLFASSFIQGYATALTTSGTKITSVGLGLSVQKETPDLSGKGKILVALGEVGKQYASLIGPIINKPPTVTVDSGTGVGILLLTDIIAPNA